jgi:FkbM family methyltransferase
MSTTLERGLTDEAVIRAFPRYTGHGQPGFVTDFLGTRTRTGYIATLGHMDGATEDYPFPVNFHATAMEWAGTLRSVLEAGDELVVVELGAGWAPWLVSAARAAELRGVGRVRLVGVEGDAGHCAFMRTHFADNGLDPDAHALIEGVVGPSDGWAEFAVVSDPASAYGTVADYGPKAPPPAGGLARRAYRKAKRLVKALLGRPAAPPSPIKPTRRVRCYSLETLLQPFERVDLVHIDIQGSEAEVVPAAAAVLDAKVRRVVIGTHGRAIEQGLLDGMAARGWVLESDEGCRYVQAGRAMVLDLDGCQVWRNPAVAPARRAAA